MKIETTLSRNRDELACQSEIRILMTKCALAILIRGRHNLTRAAGLIIGDTDCMTLIRLLEAVTPSATGHDCEEKGFTLSKIHTIYYAALGLNQTAAERPSLTS